MNIDAIITKNTAILQQRLDPRLSVRFEPAEDESVDDEFQILLEGKPTAWTVQSGYRYAGVNLHRDGEDEYYGWDAPTVETAFRMLPGLMKKEGF